MPSYIAIAWLLKREVPIAAFFLAKQLVADIITEHPEVNKGT